MKDISRLLVGALATFTIASAGAFPANAMARDVDSEVNESVVFVQDTFGNAFKEETLEAFGDADFNAFKDSVNKFTVGKVDKNASSSSSAKATTSTTSTVKATKHEEDGLYAEGGDIDKIQYYENGQPVKGWYNFGGRNWGYFDEDGYAHKGWLEYNGDWYYMSDLDGIMLTCCQVQGYYLGADGKWDSSKDNSLQVNRSYTLTRPDNRMCSVTAEELASYKSQGRVVAKTVYREISGGTMHRGLEYYLTE